MDRSLAIQRVGPVTAKLPAYQTVGSAGMDLHAALEAPVTLRPGERRAIPTGIAAAVYLEEYARDTWRRVRDERGRSRLIFLRASVEAFATRHVDELQHAAVFSRIEAKTDPDQRIHNRLRSTRADRRTEDRNQFA